MSRQGLRAGDIRIEEQRATTARGLRRPEYNFSGTTLAEYTLVPCMFAPVLAGDTVSMASFQARIIAVLQDNNQVRGSWFEMWTFFVRIGDMADAANIRDVLIDPAEAATIDWRDQCMQAIWRVYFRDETEVSSSWASNAFLRNPRVGWWDSSRDEASLPDTSGAADDWEAQWIQYQALRRAKLTVKTWEEYLGSQGVNVPLPLRAEVDPEQQVPELLQYSREFVYPQMSMAPSSGGSITPQGTLQWFVNDRLKRARFAAEPGFLVTCVAVRPKRYVISYASDGTTVAGAAFDPLTVYNDSGGWMPIDLDTDPHAALRAVPGGYFGDTISDYVLDTREVLLFGQDEWQAGSNRNRIQDLNSAAWTRMAPKTGSRPTTSAMSYSMDFRAKLGVKSRVNKDTTR